MELDSNETKHWYKKLIREEKEIAKVMMKINKIKEKRKLKQMAKQWKIEYDRYFDAEYEDFDNLNSKIKELQNKAEEDNKNISKTDIKKQLNNNEDDNLKNNQDAFKLRKGFNDLEELILFEDNIDKMKYYKRTSSNVLSVLNSILNSNKQNIKENLLGNLNIEITNASFNKAITVLNVTFILPDLESYSPTFKVNKDENGKLISANYDYRTDKINNYKFILTPEEEDMKNNIYNDITNKLNKSSKYISYLISKEIRFKYLIDIRFIKDDFYDDLKIFNDFTVDTYNKAQTSSNNESALDPDVKDSLNNYLYKSKDYTFDLVENILKDNKYKFSKNKIIKQKFMNLIKDSNNRSFSEFINAVKSNPELNKTDIYNQLNTFYISLLNILEEDDKKENNKNLNTNITNYNKYDNNISNNSINDKSNLSSDVVNYNNNSDSINNTSDEEELNSSDDEYYQSNEYAMDRLQFGLKNKLTPTSIKKINEKEGIKSIREERIKQQTRKEDNVKLSKENLNKRRKQMNMLMKYNLSLNELKNSKELIKHDSVEDIVNNFVSVYQRDYNNNSAKNKSNNIKVSSSAQISSDYKKDLKKLRKDKIMHQINEIKDKELIDKMMFKSKKDMKANAKAINFWRNLDNNY